MCIFVGSLSEIAKSLAPVAVGGLLTILGACAPKMVEALFQTRREKRRTLEERLERLLAGSYTLDVWISDFYEHYLFDQKLALDSSPEAAISIAVKLYFPELELVWATLDARIATCKKWAVEAGQGRMATWKPGQPKPPPSSEVLAQFKEVYQGYRDAKLSFEKAICDYARSVNRGVNK